MKVGPRTRAKVRRLAQRLARECPTPPAGLGYSWSMTCQSHDADNAAPLWRLFYLDWIALLGQAPRAWRSEGLPRLGLWPWFVCVSCESGSIVPRPCYPQRDCGEPYAHQHATCHRCERRGISRIGQRGCVPRGEWGSWP